MTLLVLDCDVEAGFFIVNNTNIQYLHSVLILAFHSDSLTGWQ